MHAPTPLASTSPPAARSFGHPTRRVLATSLVLGLVLAGCSPTQGTGGPVDTAAPTPAATPTSTAPDTERPDPVTTSEPTPPQVAVDVEVFWIGGNADTIVAQPRTTPARDDNGLDRITAAVTALLAGPTSDEVAAGLTTAIPTGVRLLGVSASGEPGAPAVVTVDVTREFESGGGATAMLGRLAQLTWTVTQEPSVTRVMLSIDGIPATQFSGEGIEVGDGMTRTDFVGVFDQDDDGTDDGQVVPVWGQGEIGPRDPDDADWLTVVDVASDDTLNVRTGAGTDNDVIGRLRPGTMVPGTGATTSVGDSTWYQVTTPVGDGWANGAYLTATTPSPGEVATAAQVVIDEFAQRLRDGRDVRDLVSSDGLWVAHHAPPILFPAADVDDAIDDPTPRPWGSNALEPGNPEIPLETFREAVADPFVSVWLDDDTTRGVNMVQAGPNGRLESHVIPAEFQGLPFVTALDPGDNPDYGGLDWQLWVVSVVNESGEPRIRALTLDEWAP